MSGPPSFGMTDAERNLLMTVAGVLTLLLNRWPGNRDLYEHLMVASNRMADQIAEEGAPAAHTSLEPELG